MAFEGEFQDGRFNSLEKTYQWDATPDGKVDHQKYLKTPPRSGKTLAQTT